MRMNLEEYHIPASLEEAVSLLHQGGGATAVIAGGTELVAHAAPGIRAVVDITRLGLKGIESTGEGMRLGACTTLQEIAEAPILTGFLGGILPESALSSALRLIRNAATVGGNLATANPAWDLLTAFLATDTTVDIFGPDGPSVVPVGDFLGRRDELLAPGHIITAVHVPRQNRFTTAAFEKLCRLQHEPGIATAAARLSARDGTMASVRVVVGAVAPLPVRCPRAEQALEGRCLDDATLEAALDALGQDVEAVSDVRGSAEYRKEMARVLVGRAVRRAHQLSAEKS